MARLISPSRARPSRALRGVDDGKKFQRGRRDAAVAVAVAQRKLHQFVIEAALQAEPFFQHTAGGRGAWPASANGSAGFAGAIGAGASSASAFRPDTDPSQIRPHASMIARHACDRPKNPI